MILWIYSFVCTVIVTLFLVLGLPIFIKISRRKVSKKPIPIQRENWERDVVYLIQFPCVPLLRTISPFALKVTTEQDQIRECLFIQVWKQASDSLDRIERPRDP